MRRPVHSGEGGIPPLPRRGDPQGRPCQRLVGCGWRGPPLRLRYSLFPPREGRPPPDGGGGPAKAIGAANGLSQRVPLRMGGGGAGRVRKQEGKSAKRIRNLGKRIGSKGRASGARPRTEGTPRETGGGNPAPGRGELRPRGPAPRLPREGESGPLCGRLPGDPRARDPSGWRRGAAAGPPPPSREGGRGGAAVPPGRSTAGLELARTRGIRPFN